MKDLFEAIERLSAQLSYRLEHIAKKSSLAVHFSGYSVSPKPGTLVRLFNTMIHLPKGYAVSFNPRSQAEPGGQSWHIDIRRNDGVARASWGTGITIRKLGEAYALTYDGRQLVGEDIHKILGDLEKPGLSGMALSIARLWIMMYGRMPHDFSTRLEGIRDVDLLDRIYDALVNDDGADRVDAMLPAPLPPLPTETVPRSGSGPRRPHPSQRRQRHPPSRPAQHLPRGPVRPPPSLLRQRRRVLTLRTRTPSPRVRQARCRTTARTSQTAKLRQLRR